MYGCPNVPQLQQRPWCDQLSSVCQKCPACSICTCGIFTYIITNMTLKYHPSKVELSLRRYKPISRINNVGHSVIVFCDCFNMFQPPIPIILAYSQLELFGVIIPSMFQLFFKQSVETTNHFGIPVILVAPFAATCRTSSHCVDQTLPVTAPGYSIYIYICRYICIYIYI